MPHNAGQSTVTPCGLVPAEAVAYSLKRPAAARPSKETYRCALFGGSKNPAEFAPVLTEMVMVERRQRNPP
jgi:hypothetical protein